MKIKNFLSIVFFCFLSIITPKDIIASENIILNNNISEYRISPKKLGFKLTNITELKGGSPPMNAEIILDLLKGKKSPHRDIVILNAAAAIFASGKTENLVNALKIASESIDSGKALTKLNKLIELSRSMN